METRAQERDLLDILESNLKLREQLASLERDSENWDREREMNDLESISALVKKLEEDISKTMSDFSAAGGGAKAPVVREDFRHAFQIMNELFKDLKEVKQKLEEAYLQPEKVRQLEIDWERLEKTFETMEKHLLPMRRDPQPTFF